MTTPADFKTWLRKKRKRVFLVEIDYMYQVGTGGSATPTKGTLYFGTSDYVDSSVPRMYRGRVQSIPKYARSIDRTSLTGQFSATTGNVELSNADRDLDAILTYCVDGSDVRVYCGDPDWVRSDFVLLFTAVSSKIAAPSTKRLSVTLRDTGILLNKTIGGEITVGGTGPSAQSFRPINFGYVHQLLPISSNAATSTYVHSDTGTNTAAVAVRNNGVAVAFTDNADGTFTCTVPPAGNEVITCDVSTHAASATVDYRLSHAIDELIGNRAGLTALGKYAGAQASYSVYGVNDYHVGVSIPDKRNVIDLLVDLMSAGNAFWAVNRSGQFYYGWMRPEALAALISLSGGVITVEATITQDDVRAGTGVALDHNLPTYSSYQAIVDVNWTNQTVFASSLTESQKLTYTRQGYPAAAYFGEEPSSTAYLGAVSGAPYLGGAPQLYDLTLKPSPVIPTLISAATETTIPDSGRWPTLDVIGYASNWSSVARSQHLPWMEFIDIAVGLEFYELEIGSIVNFQFPAYELDAGELHQVCSIEINPLAGTIALGLARRRFADVTGGVDDLLLDESSADILQETGDTIAL